MHFHRTLRTVIVLLFVSSSFIGFSQSLNLEQTSSGQLNYWLGDQDLSEIIYKDYSLTGPMKELSFDYKFGIQSKVYASATDFTDYVIISKYGDVFSVWLKSSNQSYSLLYKPGEKIREMDVEFNQQLTCMEINGDVQQGHNHVDEVESNGAVNACAASPICFGVELDVMFVFTIPTANAHGGIPGVTAAIGSAVTEMNLANSNSNISHVYNAVFISQVNHSETGDGGDDLWDFRNDGDGIMDEVHDWRIQYGADLCALIVQNSNVCGVGYRPGNPLFPNSDQGFTLTAYGCMTGNLTLPHELGHNMGATHDRYVSSNGLCGFFYGYVNENFPDGSSSRWRTIMAYNDQCSDSGVSCGRIVNFSNPDVFHNGDPTGKDISDPEAANNAYGFERSICYVSEYFDKVTCNDGIQNGDETDVDCGGSSCPPCGCPDPNYQVMAQIYTDMGGSAWTNSTGWNNDNSDCDFCNWSGVVCNNQGQVIELNLDNNNLNGPISSSISNLSFLNKLVLSNNPSLTGGIPSGFIGLSQLNHLDLKGNSMSGTIPQILIGLSSLQYLDLSENNFINEVPGNIFLISALDFLDLSDNQLIGELPLQMLIPPFASIVDLSNNQLSGCIPFEFSNLCGSMDLDLSGNVELPNGGDFDAFCMDYTGVCCVLNASSSGNSTTCGMDNGTIEIDLVTGFDPVEVFIDGNLVEDSLITNLSSGSYEILIQDGLNCKVEQTIVIDSTSMLDIEINVSDAECGSSNGSAQIEVESGNGPVIYIFEEDTLQSNMIQNLAAGNYELTAEDSLGCSDVFSFDISETNGVAAEYQSSNTTCGESNGMIVLVDASGNGMLTYYVNGAEVDSELIENLEAGTYEVQIIDEENCMWAKTIEIDNSSPSSISIESSNPNCKDNNGQIQINVESAVAPYEIFLNGELISEEGINDLPEGEYSVELVDGDNCISTEVVSLVKDGEIDVVLNTSNISCIDECNGQAEIIVDAPDYELIWSDGMDRGLNPEDLCPGEYSLEVVYGDFCSGMINFEIQESTLDVVSVNSSNSLCDSPSGSVQLLNTTGVTVLWEDGSNNTEKSDLAPGNYKITLTDAGGCERIEEVVIITEDGPSLMTNTQQISCFEVNDGTIEVNIDGGTGPYVVLWEDGSNELIRTNLGPGEYDVVVTDANNCTAAFAIELEAPSALQGIIDFSNALCFDSNDGLASLDPSGGTAPLMVEWSTGDEGNEIQDLAPGTYWCQITDANNCLLYQEFEISAPDALTNQLDLNSDTGEDVIEAIPNGGVAPYDFVWNDGSTNNKIVPIDEGWYTVVITDSNGCSLEDSLFYNVSSVNDQYDSDLSIFPNPFKDQLSISWTENISITALSIFDLQGSLIQNRQVANNGTNQYILDMKSLAQGVYVVRLEVGGDVIVKRLIKL